MSVNIARIVDKISHIRLLSFIHLFGFFIGMKHLIFGTF